MNGGEWGSASLSYAELLITGHADGTLKFYDASSVNLHILYKMKTSKLFEKPKLRANATSDELDDPFAIDQITLCSESRLLCVAGASSQVSSNTALHCSDVVIAWCDVAAMCCVPAAPLPHASNTISCHLPHSTFKGYFIPL